MTDVLFVLTLATLLAATFSLAFFYLPQERWQILAVLPVKAAEGRWQGANLTFYGFLLASAYALSLAVSAVLLSSLGLGLGKIVGIFALVLVPATPAASLVARWVEKKAARLTVAGGGFVGLLLAPWVLWGVTGRMGLVLPALAALAAAFVLGEGVGRLACISFGCCYGKPLSELPPTWGRLLQPLSFVFRGRLKKISWSSGLEGVRVVPIQAMTALVLSAVAVGGIVLFLAGEAKISLTLTMLGSLVWRVLSEQLRADERGEVRDGMTAYQKMSVVGVLYVVALLLWAAPSSIDPDLAAGLAALWDPLVILSLQAVWLVMFLWTGWSQVTSAHISFQLNEE